MSVCPCVRVWENETRGTGYPANETSGRPEKLVEFELGAAPHVCLSQKPMSFISCSKSKTFIKSAPISAAGFNSVT